MLDNLSFSESFNLKADLQRVKKENIKLRKQVAVLKDRNSMLKATIKRLRSLGIKSRVFVINLNKTKDVLSSNEQALLNKITTGEVLNVQQLEKETGLQAYAIFKILNRHCDGHTN